MTFYKEIKTYKTKIEKASKAYYKALQKHNEETMKMHLDVKKYDEDKLEILHMALCAAGEELAHIMYEYEDYRLREATDTHSEFLKGIL